MHKSTLVRLAGIAFASCATTLPLAAGLTVAPLSRAEPVEAVAAAANPPLVNWSAPQFFDPPRGAFSSDGSFGRAGMKAARTLATFIPLPPCRLVDTRGAFNPAIPSPTGPFTNNEVRVYRAPGNCGIPAGSNRVQAVSIAVTTLPTSVSGDVEVIAANRTLGGTVLMVIQAGLWNSATTQTGVDSNGDFKVTTRFSQATNTHMAIDVNGYYASMDPANTNDFFSIVGNYDTDGGLLDITEQGANGAALRAVGGGGTDVRLAQGGNAIDVRSGDLRVANAGVDTPTFAFIHQTRTTAPANICDNVDGLDAHYSRLSNASETFDPTADLSGLLLYIQQVGNGTTKPVSVVYFAGKQCAGSASSGNGWYLFNSASTFTAGERYNVMVVRP